MATTPVVTGETKSFALPRGVAGLLRLLAALIAIVVFPWIFGLGLADFGWVLQPGLLRFLGIGTIATVTASLVAILLSLPLATLLALARFAKGAPQRYAAAIFIEGIRSIPVLLLIFYVNSRFPGLAAIENLSMPDAIDFFLGALLSQQGLAVVLALTVYTAVVNAELIRSGMASLDRGQFEAARSLGMSYWQMMRLVVLPQTFRRILPPLIAQFTTLVKDTSLGSIIGFVELQRAAIIIYQRPGYNVMAVLYIAALIYFVINYLLGKASIAIQQRSGGLPPQIDMG